MANGANLQDTFLNQARREKQFLTVFLTNGFQLRGRLMSFDSFTVMQLITRATAIVTSIENHVSAPLSAAALLTIAVPRK